MKKLITLIFILLLIDFSYAQYFGRNKVQYERFNFRVLQTDNFKIHFYENEDAAADAGVMLERWNNRFSQIFKRNVQRDQPIILYSNHADFQQTNVLHGMIPQGTGGVTEGLKNRIILPLTGVYSENDHVLGHELVHAFQYDIFRASSAGLASTQQTPLWFVEGLAEYLSIGRVSTLTAMWMRDAVLNDDVPTFNDVSFNYRYFPYRYGHSIWAFIGSNWSDEASGRLFKAVVDSGWIGGFNSTLRMTPDSVSALWQQALRDTYTPQLTGKTPPEELGQVLIRSEDRIALSPVISPDGKFVALYTTEEIFSLDLYIIDAFTGETVTRLVRSNTDRHFDALRFINAAGTWSPDSRSFAFIIIEGGRDRVAFADVQSRRIRETVTIEGVDEISHLAWSPDGNNILVSGTSNGINDLFIYNIKSRSVRKITDDKFSELQPSWSPDGNYILFSTDRGGETNFENFIFSPMKIALYNVETEQINLISISDRAKHVNPLFSFSGREIYFVADPDGITNLYRYSLDSEEFNKVTNVATGISGLTQLSPSISIAKNTGRMILSVFNSKSYNIHALNPDELIGEPFELIEDDYLTNAGLPETDKAEQGVVHDYMNEPEDGLPLNREFTVTNYRPSLSLLYLGQPAIGIAVNRFGTQVGGGITGIFSDMLGNHMLGAALQMSGTFQDIGGQVIYQNRENRVNYGGAIGHIPYLTGAIRAGFDTVRIGNDLYLADKITLIRQRVFNNHLMLMADYPFSTNRRFELGSGYTRISYSIEEETILAFGGIIHDRTVEQIESPAALNLFQVSTAYVGDYSFFGFTSPISGSRFRFEAESTLGSLNFLGALADYRNYLFFNPVTFAFRGLHYGRYFGDAEDLRLAQLSIGDDVWVRGYRLGSYSLDECTQSGVPGGCPEIDRLFGSKLAVFNFETRVPLFGTDQFGLIPIGFIPLELSAFFDAGIAWRKDDFPVFDFSRDSHERIPVMSTGLAARLNLFGYIVIQGYWAYPFQRPKSNGEWGLLISPGW
jgi:WD40 repeat protein